MKAVYGPPAPAEAEARTYPLAEGRGEPDPMRSRSIQKIRSSQDYKLPEYVPITATHELP